MQSNRAKDAKDANILKTEKVDFHDLMAIVKSFLLDDNTLIYLWQLFNISVHQDC